MSSTDCFLESSKNTHLMVARHGISLSVTEYNKANEHEVNPNHKRTGMFWNYQYSSVRSPKLLKFILFLILFLIFERRAVYIKVSFRTANTFSHKKVLSERLILNRLSIRSQSMNNINKFLISDIHVLKEKKKRFSRQGTV